MAETKSVLACMLPNGNEFGVPCLLDKATLDQEVATAIANDKFIKVPTEQNTTYVNPKMYLLLSVSRAEPKSNLVIARDKVPPVDISKLRQ